MAPTLTALDGGKESVEAVVNGQEMADGARLAQCEGGEVGERGEVF